MASGDSLHAFVSRLLGWTRDEEVDHALRSLELAASHRAHLVLCGAGDLVPIASALHRRTLGTGRPFIVCDPRRRDAPASVRSPANQENGVAALDAARGGSLCVRSSRLPRDFSTVAALVRDPGVHVQFIVCADLRSTNEVLLTVPVPITIRSLRDRVCELPRVVDEYALDAITALGEHRNCFSDHDRAWVLEYASSSLMEIEKATLRLVALRTSANMSGAAERLGMAPVSLSRWVGRRRPPSTLPAT